VAICAAVFVASGPSMISLQAVLLAGFLLATAPVVAHFTARAIREWDRGDWRPTDREIEEIEERR
jgi:multisubunit Na+/H+ antiporter MnhG subunit